MPALLITKPPSEQEIKLLTEEYPHYIKLTADIEKEIVYGGTRLHADAEQLLIDQGSAQQNIWGGGIDLQTKTIECSAVANIRSDSNPSDEILNPEIRQKFIDLVKRYFPNYHGQ